MKRKPYKFQLEDARQMAKMGGRVLLSSEMGTGKSLTALLYAKNHPDLRPLLIVCPASLKWNWAHEVSMGLGERYEILEGRKARKQGLLKHRILIINYDILKDWLPYLLELNIKLLIEDEAHFCASPKTQRTKAVRVLAKNIPHVLALSGTPLVNRPSELWPTLNILRPDLFPSFFTYAQRFCAPRRVPWGIGWDFKGASNIPELNEQLKCLMIRRRKEDVLKQLPKMRQIVLPIEITNRKEYDHAFKDFLGWLRGRAPGKVSRAERAERLVKVGYLKRLTAELKMPAVLEWVDNFLQSDDGKIVLFSIHKKTIATIQEHYSKISVVVDGSVTGHKRQLAVEKFQNNPKTRVFDGNMQAAGVGLTLTAASTVALLEFPWSPGLVSQAIARIDRIGQTSPTLAYFLVARDTIEEKLLEILQSKQRTVSDVLDGKGKGDTLDVFDQLCEKLLLGK